MELIWYVRSCVSRKFCSSPFIGRLKEFLEISAPKPPGSTVSQCGDGGVPLSFLASGLSSGYMRKGS